MGRKNPPLLESTRVCSDHFSQDSRWNADEVSSLNLPLLQKEYLEQTFRLVKMPVKLSIILDLVRLLLASIFWGQV
jgi:hypothetical protein